MAMKFAFGALLMIATSSGMVIEPDTSTDAARTVAYSNRSFIIDGKRELLLSGAIHYSRVPPSDWDTVFKTAKELGLNCIQTYVTWNQHEHVRGEVSWEGYGDLPRFIDLAQQNGLYVVVRIGPYICGEYYFGGLPIWLRSVDNISCFRCNDTIWEREMERWVGIVVEKIESQLYPNGGPVIMLQIENEYGPDDDYLRWAVDMALKTTTVVPWNLCHDVSQCGDLNAGQDKVICTINGFWMETGGADGQPGPAFFDALWSKNPNQPAMWTEDQGWFDQWGKAQRVRWSGDQMYGIARFFAYGGSYHNFYMLTGGNNYERKAGGEVVTAYAPDTVIDNLLLRHEPRFSFYQKFFLAMQGFANDLMSHPIARAIPLNGTTVHDHPQRSRYNDPVELSLTSCYQYPEPHQTWTQKSNADGSFSLSPASNPSMCVTTSVLAHPTLANCDGQDDQSWTVNTTTHQIISKKMEPCRMPANKGKKCHLCFDNSGGSSMDLWDCKSGSATTNQEFAIDGKLIEYDGQCVTVSGSGPSPQGSGVEAHIYGNLAFVSNYLEFTTMTIDFKGHSLYMPNETIVMMNMSSGEIVFNSSVVTPPMEMANRETETPVQEIELTNWGYLAEEVGYGSITHGMTTSPEQLNITDNDSDYLWYTGKISGKGNLKVQGMGDGTMTYSYVNGKLVNSSTMIEDGDHDVDILSVAMGLYNGGVGPTSVKGVKSISLGNSNTADFKTAWMNKGETEEYFNPANKPAWMPISGLKSDAALVWMKATFDMPKDIVVPSGGGAAQPNQTAVVLDLSGLNKGAVYVNGFNIGRYYLIVGQCEGECAPPQHGSHCFIHWKGCGRPTQHLYHIPFHLLLPTDNQVVMFEESTMLHPRDLTAVKVNILHDHPDFD